MARRRIGRDLARGRRAAARVRIRGGSAFTAACAYIGAAFSPAVHHSAFKDRVATLMHCGATHPEVRHRYRALIERYPVTNIDAALVLVEHIRRAEREARDVAIGNWGRCHSCRVTFMLLDEMRLILRALRRYAPGCFSDLVAQIRAGHRAPSVRTSTNADTAEQFGRRLRRDGFAERPRRASSGSSSQRSRGGQQLFAVSKVAESVRKKAPRS